MKSFSFSYRKQGKLPQPQLLRIAVGDQSTGLEIPLSTQATITSSAAWLSASPLIGTTVFTSQIALTSQAQNLQPGTYTATLEVTAPAPILNSPILATVNLQVTKRGGRQLGGA